MNKLPSPPPTYKRRNGQEENIDLGERNIKNITKENQITSEAEWPQFVHPEGGIIKITPWGTLRQYIDPVTQETITKFEDCNLEDYSFKSENIEKIYQTPDTPQSIYQKNGGRALRLSPGDDAEGYVIEGYRELGQQVEIVQGEENRQGDRQEYFQPEHENYFGMNDAGHVEEFDFNHEEDEEMS
ncbi:conserved hypothetical protein [Candida tropicalis MYA-3404]|uniref:Uncharacterized protein n=1 Tax=Candida tropicalis (strain ATCC MYA-3404 / T1) TaxID=294747 RepID=C5MGB5_CANTT|nr:conserved hypothetical protein [Candida tropicalis MYA-3404]EER31378.1 conserved hypothetical protein [Candida tropicalis MYA-3404]KAG4404948.1 hypothetical protein JTP64_005962 [Candida tropicalis]